MTPSETTKMSGNEIREMFLRFFESKGHRRVRSSSLVPHGDPTLLFTNAGMNQFKDVFLGLEKRDYNKATTAQKCVRAGGKHNDLENVGFTKRHHTFFEMLGNFSFGDYFKKDAIAYAWELITSKDWFAIDKAKLYVTIFNGEGGMSRDAEAYDLWVAQGVAKDRIFEFGAKDNFWQMGDTGPCGPCSEIHYDMGPAASDQGHTDCAFACDCGRYVEIWNLVFMQYNRQPRVPDGTLFGLNPLPKPSIDTGMGLERVAAVLQGVISNYDTDLFTPLTRRAAELTLTPKRGSQALSGSSSSIRVIADHSRATTFLIADGVLPSNEGRGYVLRKIIRRAITHGRLLGEKKPFLHMMVPEVVKMMALPLQSAPYPELLESAERVEKVVYQEEMRFAHTLDAGLEKLEALITRAARGWRFSGSTDDAVAAFIRETGGVPSPESVDDFRRKDKRLPGEETFKLYDTFGLPLDFMQDAARDQGIAFDHVGFDRAMAEQRTRARASWKGAAKQTANPAYQQLPKSVFEGYRQTRSDGCEVLAIIHNGQGARELKAGESGEVILDHTSFYAESGGQVGDRGWFYSDDHNTIIADVTGCYSPIQGVRAHQVVAKQTLRVGDRVDAVVNADIRHSTMRNHTATHLLHAGLREVLGKHVKQAGSLVAPGHLRFDFSHFTAVEDEELQDIEDIINKEVLRNLKVETLTDVPIDEAINTYHAMALFGEKYGDKVRVVKIGDFSTELCGGTHTAATGEIGTIKLLGEGSVSSGVRRVEAVTGLGALKEFRRDFAVAQLANQLAPSVDSSPAEALRQKIAANEEELKKLRRDLDEARMKSAASSVSSAADQAVEVKGVKVLAQKVGALDRGQLRTLVDNLRNKLGSGVVVLGSVQEDGKVAIIVGVTKDLTSKLSAGKIIAPVAKQVGGSGGGRPDMAEAGGKDAEHLDAALASVPEVVASFLP